MNRSGLNASGSVYALGSRVISLVPYSAYILSDEIHIFSHQRLGLTIDPFGMEYPSWTSSAVVRRGTPGYKETHKFRGSSEQVECDYLLALEGHDAKVPCIMH